MFYHFPLCHHILTVLLQGRQVDDDAWGVKGMYACGAGRFTLGIE
jgi:hypothetical protein